MDKNKIEQDNKNKEYIIFSTTSLFECTAVFGSIKIKRML